MTQAREAPYINGVDSSKVKEKIKNCIGIQCLDQCSWQVYSLAKALSATCSVHDKCWYLNRKICFGAGACN